MLALFTLFLFLKHFVVGENHYLNIYTHQKINSFNSTHSVQTVVQCGTLCTNSDNCSSASYNYATGECQLSEASKWNINGQLGADEDWTVLVIEPEKTLGSACEVNSDCLEPNSLCIKKRCFCNYTAVYNPQTGACDTECNEYSDGYDKYEGMVIDGHNKYHNTSVTVDWCKDQCANVIGVTCGSFDHLVATSVCRFNLLTYQQVQDAKPSIFRDDDIFDLYTRHC